MILCIGATPAVQRVMIFEALALNTVNRAVTTADGIAGKSLNVAKVLKTLGERPVALGFWAESVENGCRKSSNPALLSWNL